MDGHGVLGKEFLQQCGGSPCVVALEVGLAEVPPHEVNFVLGDEGLKDGCKVLFVAVVVPKLALACLCLGHVTCGVGDAAAGGVVVFVVPVDEGEVVAGFDVILGAGFGVFVEDVDAFLAGDVELVDG